MTFLKVVATWSCRWGIGRFCDISGDWRCGGTCVSAAAEFVDGTGSFTVSDSAPGGAAEFVGARPAAVCGGSSILQRKVSARSHPDSTESRGRDSGGSIRLAEITLKTCQDVIDATSAAMYARDSHGTFRLLVRGRHLVFLPY